MGAPRALPPDPFGGMFHTGRAVGVIIAAIGANNSRPTGDLRLRRAAERHGRNRLTEVSVCRRAECLSRDRVHGARGDA